MSFLFFVRSFSLSCSFSPPLSFHALSPRFLSSLSSLSLFSLFVFVSSLSFSPSLSLNHLSVPLFLSRLSFLSPIYLSPHSVSPPPPLSSEQRWRQSQISLLTLSLLSLSLSSFLSLQNKNKTCIPKHRAYHVSGYQKYVGLLRDQDVSSDGRVDELSGVAGNADAQRERRLRDRERAKVGAVAGRAAGELRRVCDLVVIPGLFIYSLGTT